MKVLLIRPNRNEADQLALQKVGIESVIDPYLGILQVDNYSGALRMLKALQNPNPKWLVLTSSNALTFWKNLLPSGALEETIAKSTTISFAAIGSQTELQLKQLGAKEVLRADEANSESLGWKLASLEPKVAVIPAGSIAMKNLEQKILQSDFDVITEVVYETLTLTQEPSSVCQVLNREFDAVLLRSPSAARAFLHFIPNPELLLICGGKTTGETLLSLGYSIGLLCEDPDSTAIAKRIADYFRKESY
jgi:uroporphyrinogen-III synthase